ncbi:MAG: radical SAM protein [Bacteroidales bacterium]|nr:radical SAM protein [Bacteroidales bacterium]
MDIKYFNIDWISNNDGPGKRLVLFLQKCHLECAWCHSPHSQGECSPLLFFSGLCIKCGACVDSCTSNVHTIINDVHQIERGLCLLCGDCIKACPSSNEEKGALVLPTKSVDVNILYKKLRPQLLMLKDIGGITISGGEPLLQAEAVKLLLKLCKQDDINTAIETSGIISVKNYKILSSLVDTWLLGFRLTTNEEKIDGKLLKIFSESLSYLSKLPNTQILARIPVIPNHNTFDEYYNKVLELLNNNNIQNVDLLKYNAHTSHYYKAIGKDFNDKELIDLTNSKYENAKTYFLTNKITLYEN